MPSDGPSTQSRISPMYRCRSFPRVAATVIPKASWDCAVQVRWETVVMQVPPQTEPSKKTAKKPPALLPRLVDSFRGSCILNTDVGDYFGVAGNESLPGNSTAPKTKK